MVSLNYKAFFEFYLDLDVPPYEEESLLYFVFIHLYWNEHEHTKCPKCGNIRSFNPVKNRQSFQCPACSFQIYPLANTIFNQTTTPLTAWCKAYHLIKGNASARKVQKELNISNKTALRICRLIKSTLIHP